MKFSAINLLALASSAFAAGIADLPACSISCFTTGIASSGCGLSDYSCICGSGKDAITASVTPCLQGACSAADQAKTLQVTNNLCAQYAAVPAAAPSHGASAISSAASAAPSSVSGVGSSSTAEYSAATASDMASATGTYPAMQSVNAAPGLKLNAAVLMAAALAAL